MITLEYLSEAYFPEMVEIHAQCFPDAWDFNGFTEISRQKGVIILGAFEKCHKGLIGFCMYQQLFEIVEIITLCVMPEWQGKGVAMQIMDCLIAFSIKESIDKVILEVRESNSVALSFYTKLGFINCRTRQNYYPNGENAIVMMKHLPNK
jgi:ribosomal-protein-alanine N-acetyltransferase